MKRIGLWSTACLLALCAVLWTVAQIAKPSSDIASLFPDHALLYIQSADFNKLLSDWNSSEEKRTWISGDDYAAFSRSRLFQRLAQAQSEFSAAASIATDQSMLSSIAGKESALALYDIGNLQFVYITRMSQAGIEATPLWQVRDKFEQRTEGATRFYVRVDQQTSRTAAFAALNGWLILGTREDLVAGAIDRVAGMNLHSLADEPWYADAVKQAAGPAGDLRMVLNLESLVPSPYFRSYWIQRNITEMTQYRAAISDLHRKSASYYEDRILLRKSGIGATRTGNVALLLALAPQDAVFTSAQSAPGVDVVLAVLRDNLLDLKPVGQQPAWQPAPTAASSTNAGDASMLERRIDVAPAIVAQSDPYQPLRALLAAAQPSAMLQTDTTASPQAGRFIAIHHAVLLTAPSPWNEVALQAAISTALQPGLTASQLGLKWSEHTGANGAWSSLEGQVPLFVAARGTSLFVADNASLLEALLARQAAPLAPVFASATYMAVFRHTPREQKNFQHLVHQLDHAGHSAAGSDLEAEGSGQPPFFSGNVASLSLMFSSVDQETVTEQDTGPQVTQTVVYRWKRP